MLLVHQSLLYLEGKHLHFHQLILSFLLFICQKLPEEYRQLQRNDNISPQEKKDSLRSQHSRPPISSTRSSTLPLYFCCNNRKTISHTVFCKCFDPPGTIKTSRINSLRHSKSKSCIPQITIWNNDTEQTKWSYLLASGLALHLEENLRFLTTHAAIWF